MAVIKIINQSKLFNLKSGVDITSQVSGANNIGSANYPFNTIYVNNIVPPVSGSSASGNFVLTSGTNLRMWDYGTNAYRTIIVSGGAFIIV